jgi:hypothetical protein
MLLAPWMLPALATETLTVSAPSTPLTGARKVTVPPVSPAT